MFRSDERVINLDFIASSFDLIYQRKDCSRSIRGTIALSNPQKYNLPYYQNKDPSRIQEMRYNQNCQNLFVSIIFRTHNHAQTIMYALDRLEIIQNDNSDSYIIECGASQLSRGGIRRRTWRFNLQPATMTSQLTTSRSRCPVEGLSRYERDSRQPGVVRSKKSFKINNKKEKESETRRSTHVKLQPVTSNFQTCLFR